jgi:hypothetical protein
MAQLSSRALKPSFQPSCDLTPVASGIYLGILAGLDLEQWGDEPVAIHVIHPDIISLRL